MRIAETLHQPRGQVRGGSTAKEQISMPNLLRMTGRVLACFVAFDLVGVALTLLVELVAALDIVWESSTLLGYVVWFVVGVFCALFIYTPSDDADLDSPEVRRRGLKLLAITSVVAVVLGVLSSFVWSVNADETVAPDHRGVTITYLATVVLVIACLRFVLFRGHVRVEPRSAETPDESKRYQRALKRFEVASTEQNQKNPDRKDPDVFRPAGFWATVGLLVGVPVLFFLDASFFVLGPFDFFDRWTDPILTTSLVGGLAWGFASARWESPRIWLVLVHLPPLTGTICWGFAILLGALLVGLGVPGRVSEVVSYVGFGIGFLFGCGAIVILFADMFRAVFGRVVRS